MRILTAMESEMKRVIMIVAMGFVMFGCAATARDKPPLTVVDSVDLERYLGKWYEIASYPAWFQKGCTGSTAEYSLLPDGKIRGGQSLSQGQPRRTAKRIERQSRGCGYRHQRQTQSLVFLALQGQLLDHRSRSRITNGPWLANPHGNIYGF
jgi:lipocalin